MKISNYSVSCDLVAEPAPTDSDRHRIGPNDLCRSMPESNTDKDPYRVDMDRDIMALDWCRSKQVGADPVLVWIVRCRSKSLGAGAGGCAVWPRCCEEIAVLLNLVLDESFIEFIIIIKCLLILRLERETKN